MAHRKCCKKSHIIKTKPCESSSSTSSSCSSSSSSSCVTKPISCCYKKKCCKSKNIKTAKNALAAFVSGNVPKFFSYLDPNVTLIYYAPSVVPAAGHYQGLTGHNSVTTFLTNFASGVTGPITSTTQSVQFSCGFKDVTQFVNFNVSLICPNNPSIIRSNVSVPTVIENTFNCKGQIIAINIGKC